MRLKKEHVVLIAVFMTGAFYACNKDKATPSTPIYDPTPYMVDLPDFARQRLGEMPQPADNPLTVEGVALGRRLFYEKMLSKDNSISCASCHSQEHAFDDPDQFSEGVGGTRGVRNAMSVANLGWTPSLFWDGRRNSLEAQAHDPVTNPIEMASLWPDVVAKLQSSTVYPDLFFEAFGTHTVDSSLVMKAIAQFERTLISFNSRFDAYYYGSDTTVFNEKERNGFRLFTDKGHCEGCHTLNSLFTESRFRNNGLDLHPEDEGLMAFTKDPTDWGKFKTPNLRNVAVTGPYMHDGRFATLEDVINFYSNEVKQASPNIDAQMAHFGHSGMNFTRDEVRELVAFLQTLTDSSFLTNEAFSDPNK